VEVNHPFSKTYVFQALHNIRVTFLRKRVYCIFRTNYDCRGYIYPGIIFYMGDKTFALCRHKQFMP